MESVFIENEQFICTQCKQSKPIHKNGGTGYGILRDSQDRICYQCIGENDKKELENAKIGDKFTFYLTNTDNKGYKVSNWPGSFSTDFLHCRKGKHNIARVRYDVWFKVGKNQFHGVTFGDWTQICHVKCIKPCN